MITKNIKFKNFLIKKNFLNVSNKLKLLLKEDNKILNIAIDFQNNTDFHNSIPKF